ncbi:hypothetical protein B0H19DRAFT_1055513 [Mycena capillaripes]|nr:hypothetical protein B0H19DRAFT_1055513 [Mycena capillaripes]
MPLSEDISLCSTCSTTFKQSPLLPSPGRSAQLLHILRTNCEHREISDLRALISTIPAELARYDQQIEQFDTIFEKLVAGRDALRRLYDQCIGVVDAPIRRLPREILVEIFKLCEEPREWSSEPILPHLLEHETKKELRRVAGGDLVSFSEVCTQWRQLVLGTPTLWSKISLDLRCWTFPIETTRTSYGHHRMVQLLNLALARGQQTPLTIEVYGNGECHPLALQTLAVSAHRWRRATFTVGCEMLRYLSAVAGNLPLLEILCINAVTEDLETLEDLAKFFSHAPKLRAVQFCGPLSVVSPLPLEQLRYFTSSGLGPEDLLSLLSLMDRFQNTELHIQINFETIGAALPLDLPPVVSSIEELDICSMDHTEHLSHRVLAEIFGTLTLPQMRRLQLYGEPTSQQPLYWPHAEGFAFLVRSGSRSMLQSLSLHDVIITEHDLLQCLAEVPLLQYLFISDHSAVVALPGNPVHHLVTDSLLRKLTPHQTECLVPKLSIVDLKTFGRFTDEVFLAFVVQRSLVFGPVEPFECALLWAPGHTRGLNDQVTRSLNSGMQRGCIVFTCRDYDEYEDD